MKSKNQVALKDYQCPQCHSYSLNCANGFLAGSSAEMTGATNENFSASDLSGFYF